MLDLVLAATILKPGSRDAEVVRILTFDHLNRIQRARDDSGQNEAE